MKKTSREYSHEEREERRARKRATNPETLHTPGTASNRAARRLARKNGVSVEELQFMERAGAVQRNERRVDREKSKAMARKLKKLKDAQETK